MTQSNYVITYYNCDILCRPHIDSTHVLEAVESVKFKEWEQSVRNFGLKSITVEDVLFQGNPSPESLLFMWVTVSHNQIPYPEKLLIRGGCVAILTLFTVDENTRYTSALVQLPRVAGSLNSFELPAGMLDGNGDFSGVAAKELQEELDITVNVDELIPLSPPEGIFPSIGACDEKIHYFLLERSVTQQWIDAQQGKQTGVADEHESITVNLVQIPDLLKVAAQDGKVWTALALYQLRTGVNLLSS